MVEHLIVKTAALHRRHMQGSDLCSTHAQHQPNDWERERERDRETERETEREANDIRETSDSEHATEGEA